MIQLVVNVNLLREIDERKLINAYAHLIYNDEKDVTDDNKIKENLIQLFDWDKNGDKGLGIYCSKFESIKRKDWNILIQFIKENKYEIKVLSYGKVKERKLEGIKLIRNRRDAEELKRIARFTSKDYTVSTNGKSAKPCTYEGRKYKSRQECMYKEKISQSQLYRYLEKTGQV